MSLTAFSINRTNRTWQSLIHDVVEQSAYAQNTWYTILDKTDQGRFRLITLYAMTEDTGETLEAKLTIDGLTLTKSNACLADTGYNVYKSPTADGLVWGAANTPLNTAYYNCLECKTGFKYELQKTSNNGNGTLNGSVVYLTI